MTRDGICALSTALLMLRGGRIPCAVLVVRRFIVAGENPGCRLLDSWGFGRASSRVYVLLEVTSTMRRNFSPISVTSRNGAGSS